MFHVDMLTRTTGLFLEECFVLCEVDMSAILFLKNEPGPPPVNERKHPL